MNCIICNSSKNLNWHWNNKPMCKTCFDKLTGKAVDILESKGLSVNVVKFGKGNDYGR